MASVPPKKASLSVRMEQWVQDSDEAAWQENDRFYPGNWFLIPDFGIMPADRDFEGFSKPIRYPGHAQLSESVRGLVSCARQLLQRDGVLSLADLPRLMEYPEESWRPEVRAAHIYTAVIEDLECVDVEGGLELLAGAAEWISVWALNGAREAFDKLEKRRSQPKLAAKQPRPGALSPLKARMQAMMKPYRRSDTSFKVFLQAWIDAEGGTLDDLTITVIEAGSQYEVADDRADVESTPYTYSTLQTIYSKAI